MAFKNKRKLYSLLQCCECGGELIWNETQAHCQKCQTKVVPVNQALVFKVKGLTKDYLKPSYASTNPYNFPSIELIKESRNKIILDWGAGSQKFTFDNVIQLDISLYSNTDLVYGTNSKLPFKNDSLDGVISLAVLEHVKNPFMYIREIYRVLKPGGTCILDTAFMQPLHASPYHYFNTTHHAVKLLFNKFKTKKVIVGPHQHPWISLYWILDSYISSMSPRNRKLFLSQSILNLMTELSTITNRRNQIKGSQATAYKIAKQLWQFEAEPSKANKGLFVISKKKQNELAAGFNVIASK